MINEKRLLDTFIGYAMIDSETKNEKAMGEKLVEDLKALGLEVKTDKAGEGFDSPQVHDKSRVFTRLFSFCVAFRVAYLAGLCTSRLDPLLEVHL